MRAKTPAGCAADWALRSQGAIYDGLPRLPRGLTEREIERAMRALCDLLKVTEPDTPARWYGVLGVFHLLAESSGEGFLELEVGS